jgi:hypothetical protein
MANVDGQVQTLILYQYLHKDGVLTLQTVETLLSKR